MKKGISLIVLIITIIVIIILAGAVIISLNNANIIMNSEQALFKNNIDQYKTELEMYISNKMLEDLNEVNITTDETLNIEKVIHSIKEEDKGNFKVINNKLYYVYNNGKKDYIKWAKDVGCEVIINGELADSEYKKNNKVYCYSPSLLGFKKENLNYVTYGFTGEKRYSALSDGVPDNWYDYSKGKNNWANIVTKNGEKEVYLVWIPRYAYKINLNNDIDIIFTDINNNYIDNNGVTKNALEEGYIKHSSFTLNMDDKSQKELTGFWVSKYEISDIVYNDFMLNEIDKTHFEVTGVKGSGLISFKYYVNNKFVGENNNAKFKFKEFELGINYDIKVEAYDYYGNLVGSITKKVMPAKTPIYNNANAPELIGFNKNNTYYLTYNNNKEVRTIITEPIPNNWYDYNKDKKQWANIVTSNNGKEVYLVWIPRYEYRVLEGGTIDIAFIPTTQTKPTLGYKIPDAFTVMLDGNIKKELPGFWTSKYEINQ